MSFWRDAIVSAVSRRFDLPGFLDSVAGIVPPSWENESTDTSRVSSVACDLAIRGFLRDLAGAGSALVIGPRGRDPLPSVLGDCTGLPICLQSSKHGFSEIKYLATLYAVAGSNARSVIDPSLASNHSIVLRSPSSRLVRARKPNAFHARLTSRHRLGCPSGLLGSQTISPSKRESL